MIEKKPWFDWMEEALKTLYEFDPSSMLFAARLSDGTTLTAYYEADSEDKAVMMHHIQNDMIHDFIRANADVIKKYLEDGVDDE